jgi:cell division protein FtsB
MSPKLALNLGLLVLLLLLQWPLWLGKGSLWEVHKLERQLKIQEAEIAAKKERNARITSDVKDLDGGLGAAESQARRDLGMIKSDEVFIQVTPDKSNNQTPEKTKVPSNNAASNATSAPFSGASK